MSSRPLSLVLISALSAVSWSMVKLSSTATGVLSTGVGVGVGAADPPPPPQALNVVAMNTMPRVWRILARLSSDLWLLFVGVFTAYGTLFLYLYNVRLGVGDTSIDLSWVVLI